MTQPQQTLLTKRLQRTPLEELGTIVARYFADAPYTTARLRDVEHYLYGSQGIRRERKEDEHMYFLAIITQMIRQGVFHPSPHRSLFMPDLYFLDRVRARDHYL
ncbi:MAG: hypothetical protein AABW64_03225 [Nanoarchaeota archaeon]